MKDLILIHSNAQFLEHRAGLTDVQRSGFGHDHLAPTDELAVSGELVASEGSPIRRSAAG